MCINVYTSTHLSIYLSIYLYIHIYIYIYMYIDGSWRQRGWCPGYGSPCAVVLPASVKTSTLHALSPRSAARSGVVGAGWGESQIFFISNPFWSRSDVIRSMQILSWDRGIASHGRYRHSPARPGVLVGAPRPTVGSIAVITVLFSVRYTIHTVEYDPFIKSHLVSRH